MKAFAIILAAVLVCAAADTSSAAPPTFIPIEPDCVCTAGGKCTCGPACECREELPTPRVLRAIGRIPTCPFCGQRDQVTPGTPQPDGTLDDNRECWRCHKKFTKPSDPIEGDPKPIVLRFESIPSGAVEETCFKNKPVRKWFKKHFGRCG